MKQKELFSNISLSRCRSAAMETVVIQRQHASSNMSGENAAILLQNDDEDDEGEDEENVEEEEELKELSNVTLPQPNPPLSPAG